MKKNNKGFTLAEMLIVVAIIGVLIAIVTLTIGNALEKSREGVDKANIRSGYSLICNAIMDESQAENLGINTTTADGIPYGLNKVTTFKSGNLKYLAYSCKMSQKEYGWQSNGGSYKTEIAGIACSFQDKTKRPGWMNYWVVQYEYNTTTGVERWSIFAHN